MSLPEPYYDHAGVTIYLGDSYELAPLVSRAYGVDTLLADPPYGVNNNCDYTRFSGGTPHPSKRWAQIGGDDKPFDPAPFLGLGCENVVLWGANYYAERLPVGTMLIWNKRRPEKTGLFMSDGEVAWFNHGKGVYFFHHVWDGFDRASERERSLHPSQKPVALMRWCLEKCKEPKVVLDPFMGSGPTLKAAAQMGLRVIGIESHEPYAEAAASRFDQQDLFAMGSIL